MRKKVKFLIPIIALIAIISLVSCDKKDKSKEIVVSIAASLNNPMEKIAKEFTTETGIVVKYNVGSSGTLKKQILNGAKVSMYFSANREYSNELAKEGYVYKDEIYPLLTNSLVIIGDKPLENLKDLEKVNGKIAIGEINTVPAGIYAKESLEYYNVFKELKDKFVYGKSVTNVCEYVESGNAEYGIVYKTDAMNLKNSKIVYKINNDSHQKIEYTASIIKDSDNIEASEKFLDFLKSDKAKKIFEEDGFNIN